MQMYMERLPVASECQSKTSFQIMNSKRTLDRKKNETELYA